MGCRFKVSLVPFDISLVSFDISLAGFDISLVSFDISLPGFDISLVSFEISFLFFWTSQSQLNHGIVDVSPPVPHPRISGTFPGMGTPFQGFPSLSRINFSLISHLSLSWGNLRPFPLILTLCPGKEPDPPLAPPFFWNVLHNPSLEGGHALRTSS